MKPAQVTTPSDREVRVVRGFDGPARLVWRAFTEPALLQRWMLGMPGWTMPVCEMDVRVGGKYRWRWKNADAGQEFGFYGEFLEVEPQTRTVHLEYFDPGNLGIEMNNEPARVTTEFKETAGVTVVTTTIRYNSQKDRDAALATGMTDGMEMSYKLLDGVVAG